MKLEYNIEIKSSMGFKYLGSIFKNSGKCKEEVLNRIEQARKATKTLNSLLWSKYISLNTKKRIFYTVVESILSYGCEIWTVTTD
jgi:F0F1-type ATP synthase delta subunit